MPHNVKTNYGKNASDTQDLISVYHSSVISWLYPKTTDLLTDYLAIKNSGQVISGLSDYSYLITPVFKALEGTLMQIGKDLGFNLDAYNFKIGLVFNDDNLEKFYDDVLSKIEELDKDNKTDIQMWLNDARRLLRHFRHSPAHYSGDPKKSWDSAFSTGDHIFRIIDEMSYSLLQSKIFEKLKK